LGLAVGLTCVTFLVSWITNEISYDKFLKNSDKIYRVTLEGNINGEYLKSSQCPSGVGPEITREIPDIENYTRMATKYGNLIKTDDNHIFREDGYAADSTFFNVFSYEAVTGNLTTCLNSRDKIVIDEYLASKLFGNKNPVGEVLTVENHKYTVSAEIKNIPANSHIQFHFLIPTLNLSWRKADDWKGDNAITYLKLNQLTGIEAINSKITNLVYTKNAFWKNLKVDFRLQPLLEIHFSNNFKFDYAKKGNIKKVYALASIALLILLIAYINFTNLFISTALKRKKAIGVKITIGALKKNIIKEYFVEVLLYVLIAFNISIVLYKLLFPYFNSLAGQQIKFNLLSIDFLIISIPLILLTLLLAGVFPGLYLSRFKPVLVLKNNSTDRYRKINLQQILVIAQFAIAIVLIFTVILMNKQLSSLRSKDLGFDKENVVYIHTYGKLHNKKELEYLKTNLLKNPDILSIAFRGNIPTEWQGGRPLSKNPDNKNIIAMERISVDEDYFNLMKIHFIEGENIFSHISDTMNYCILNKRAAEVLGIKPPYIEKVVYSPLENNKPFTIKGIVQNVNSKALTQQVDPCFYMKAKQYSDNGILLFRISNDYPKAIKAIKSFCEENNPGFPFEYQFLNEVYDNLYKSDANTQKIIAWFTFIAILLTILGLLTLVFFITEKRIKEIGIRKVNGATTGEIMLMLSKSFTAWIVIAFIIACPIAYFAMQKWLQNYTYRTSISWWLFLVAGVVALVVALLTVSYQSYRAASKNPVESLRYE
jgi:putative ABC transport system permease protein